MPARARRNVGGPPCGLGHLRMKHKCPEPVLGILAGGGELPLRVIEACIKSGREYFVIAFKNQTPPDTVANSPHAWVRLGAAGKAIDLLHGAGVRELVFVGSIRRPSISSLRPDMWTAKFLAKTGAYSLGDDGLLSALIRNIETVEGFKVIGVETIIPGLLASPGVYGTVQPDRMAFEDIRKGVEAARNIGVMDIGQAAVACRGRVLAVEDAEGTDAMLGKIRADNNNDYGGVLVKVKKPGQEARADLPAIGVSTIDAAVRAGLSGIAVEAGGAIIVDREKVVDAADKAGLFIIGVSARPLIFLIAGEPSGDILGGRLMAALKDSGDMRFAGIGGQYMTRQGLESLFPMRELSLMGLAEVLPHIPRLLRRIRQTADKVRELKPDILITIDAPDFNFRVARRLKGEGIPLVHYVAPSVWAWKPGRARKIAGFLDHIMTLLPFEPPYFETEGLAATFVGHPVVESGADKGNGVEFRRRHNISADVPLICVLPGSRHSETARLLPIFSETLGILKKKMPDLQAVVPTMPGVAKEVAEAVSGWPVPVQMVEGNEHKFSSFAASDVALAASGTVALELAMAGTPTVIAYKMNPLTGWLASLLIRVRFANIVNIILDREAVPERLQKNCTPKCLARAVDELLGSEAAREKQINDCKDAMRRLGLGGPSPSRRAAEVVLSIINGGIKKTK